MLNFEALRSDSGYRSFKADNKGTAPALDARVALEHLTDVAKGAG
jgi:hypothetical protein